MKKKSVKKHEPDREALPGYEPYPENEDIYSKFKEEPVNLDELPADAEVMKRSVRNIKPASLPNAEGLDVPGAELDDDMEATGNPDEENDYYSLGGDNHEDLEEDKA